MSWNNKAETEKWKTDQKRKMEMYLEANMSKEGNQKIEEYDFQNLVIRLTDYPKGKSNKLEYGNIFPIQLL